MSDDHVQKFFDDLGISPEGIAQTIKRLAMEKDVDLSPAATPAAKQPCATCPWLTENAQLAHPDNWFDDFAKARYWNDIRRGEAFPCHKTYLPEAYISRAAAAEGWKATPEHSQRRECAGGLALMHRELELRERLGSAQAYFNARGIHGVSEDGFDRLRSRAAGVCSPVAPRNPTVEDSVSVEWIPWPVTEGEVALIIPPCDCPVCVRHTEAHEQTTLVAAGGQEVGIDRDIAGLVQWLWDQGAVTIGSCQSMAEAIERLWPEKRGIILAENSGAPELMNYRRIVTSDLAFIRGLIHPAFDDLADLVEEVCDDYEVAELGSGIHVAFPLADVPRLLEAL